MHCLPINLLTQASYGGQPAAPWGSGSSTAGLTGALSETLSLASGEYINQVKITLPSLPTRHIVNLPCSPMQVTLNSVGAPQLGYPVDGLDGISVTTTNGRTFGFACLSGSASAPTCTGSTSAQVAKSSVPASYPSAVVGEERIRSQILRTIMLHFQ